jgi:hypothetical protein
MRGAWKVMRSMGDPREWKEEAVLFVNKKNQKTL